ncbi:hypothetical protein RIF29_42131 [Crotalaria pallida]|uniref:O-methyltransferase n=1 Tax=Crotalaria pallida TaxID=3830 RepID=A0AAN9ECC9_CROPI
MGESRTSLRWDKKEEEEAQLDMYKYVFGFVEVAVVKCAIELGIAEAIESHGGPMTLSELASTLGCDPSRLNRIMRFLILRKIFKVSSDGCSYAQTPLSYRLIRNGPKSMAALLLLENSPIMIAPWHSLSTNVRANGKPSFENAYGEDLWSYASENPVHNALYNEGVSCDAKLTVPAVVEGCKEAFEGLSSLVDVGGGNGSAIGIVVKGCPWIRGINYDLPHVIAEAPHRDGVEHVAGDMFQSVPKADAVFLMWILHDWADEECIKILKNCREAIPKETGRVIVLEAVIEEGEKQDHRLKNIGLMLDMVMMAHNLGKERTLKEFEYLFESAGFSKVTVKAIPNIVKSVIIAFP